jgi:uncharacterized small protein (DUF1192 family)
MEADAASPSAGARRGVGEPYAMHAGFAAGVGGRDADVKPLTDDDLAALRKEFDLYGSADVDDRIVLRLLNEVERIRAQLKRGPTVPNYWRPLDFARSLLDNRD